MSLYLVFMEVPRPSRRQASQHLMVTDEDVLKQCVSHPVTTPRWYPDRYESPGSLLEQNPVTIGRPPGPKTGVDDTRGVTAEKRASRTARPAVHLVDSSEPLLFAHDYE
jgi:hypothetical protein